MTKVTPRRWLTPSGEERVGYRVAYFVNKKKRIKQFKTEHAAGRFVRKLDAVINLESVHERMTNSPTVAAYADVWLKACRVGRLGELPLEPETIVTYTGYVENWIKPNVGKLRIGAVTRADVIAFRAQLLSECNTRITARKILTAFRSILTYAVETETITSDPSTKITIKLGGRHKTVVQIHSKKNMQEIIETARAFSKSENKQTARTWTRYSLMLELLVNCGLRLSELRGLPRTALKFETAQLRITQRADRNGRIGPPKSEHGRRTLYMPDTLAARLQAWLKTHNHDLVFPSSSGRPLYPENIRKRMWERIQMEAGVPAYSLHSARHFFASRLIDDGANLKELSTDLGHADEAFTVRVYGHLFRDAESEKRRRARSNSLQLGTD